MQQPEIVRENLLSIQVCVPADWTDEQVRAFAESERPCGTTNGWQIVTDEEWEEDGEDFPARNPCEDHAGFVHIVLAA